MSCEEVVVFRIVLVESEEVEVVVWLRVADAVVVISRFEEELEVVGFGWTSVSVLMDVIDVVSKVVACLDVRLTSRD